MMNLLNIRSQLERMSDEISWCRGPYRLKIAKSRQKARFLIYSSAIVTWLSSSLTSSRIIAPVLFSIIIKSPYLN